MIAAILIFAATYLVMAVGKLPGYRLDRAGAALLGAVLRAVLPPRAAGVLVVRSRLLDVAVYLAIAALLAGMALVTVTPHG